MRHSHGQMNYKDTKPYMSGFLSVDLLTEFAAFCLTDFIDWIYIHSWFVFSTQLVNCCLHGRRNYMVLVYCCPSTVPSLWPPPPSPPSQCSVYTDSVWLVGGWWGVLKCPVDHILQEFYTGFLTRFKTYKISSPPQTKMTSKVDIKGLVSLSSFVHGHSLSRLVTWERRGIDYSGNVYVPQVGPYRKCCHVQTKAPGDDF